MTLIPPNPFRGNSPFSMDTRGHLAEMWETHDWTRGMQESIEAKLLEVTEVITPEAKAAFPVLLIDPPFPVQFVPNHWDYAWAEAELNANNEWIEMPQGRRWDDPGRREARNTTEVGNTAFVVQHGIILDQSAGSPSFVLTIKPLPANTLVDDMTERLDANGDKTYWFKAYNELSPVCSTPLPVLPPPPIIEPGVIA